jgi:hypothetical protein
VTMTYTTASEIVAEHAPDLILDLNHHVAHINVRMTKGGQPFSITLPDCTHLVGEDATAADIDAAERKVFIDALGSAKKHFEF